MARIWNLNRLPHLKEGQWFDFRVGPDCGDVVAVGGNLSVGLLLSAYAQGVFPWYSEGEEILWWSPRSRFVLFPALLHTPKSLRRKIRRCLHTGEDALEAPLATPSSAQSALRLSVDQAFDQVIAACAQSPRPRAADQPAGTSVASETWITAAMQQAYLDLHRRGYAHSVECWTAVPHSSGMQQTLVGGLYGVCLGSCFFGESMFSHQPDASKVGFALFVRFLRQQDFQLIDCQQETEHLRRFGAVAIARQQFQQHLRCGLECESGLSNWPASWEEWLLRGALAERL